MATTKLLSTDTGSIHSSIACDESGTRYVFDSMPDRDSYRALLHEMRPLLLNEKTTFLAIRNILARELDHPDVRAYLEHLKARFQGDLHPFPLFSGGKKAYSPHTMMLWLNAFEYHRDDAKRAAFDALHKTVPNELTEAEFMGMILDCAGVVIEVRELIRALQLEALMIPFDLRSRRMRLGVLPTG